MIHFCPLMQKSFYTIKENKCFFFLHSEIKGKEVSPGNNMHYYQGLLIDVMAQKWNSD